MWLQWPAVPRSSAAVGPRGRTAGKLEFASQNALGLCRYPLGVLTILACTSSYISSRRINVGIAGDAS